MIDNKNLYIDLARFASEKDYVIELRLNSQVNNKIELYNKLTDTIPVSEYPLQVVNTIINCFGLCERVVVYNWLLIFDITKL